MNMVGTYPIVLCTDMTRITLEVPTNQIAGLRVLLEIQTLRSRNNFTYILKALDAGGDFKEGSGEEERVVNTKR